MCIVRVSLLHSLYKIDPSLSSAKLTTVVHHELDPKWGLKWSYRLLYLVTLKKKSFPGGPRPDHVNHLFDGCVASMVVLVV